MKMIFFLAFLYIIIQNAILLAKFKLLPILESVCVKTINEMTHWEGHIYIMYITLSVILPYVEVVPASEGL